MIRHRRPIPLPRLPWIPGLPGFPIALAALVLVASLPGEAPAAGAWQTHIRTKDFTDLLVTDATVYCGTREAGLLRFDRATRTFTSITREPGAIASNQVTTLAFDRAGRPAGTLTRREPAERTGPCGAGERAFDGLLVTVSPP
jgi:hypothetical protein